MTARQCGHAGCLRTTNDPSGMCHDHRLIGQQQRNLQGFSPIPTPTVSGAAPRTVAQVTATSEVIFPDMVGVKVTPGMLHDRALHLVRNAVQTDVHRWFPSISVAGDRQAVSEAVTAYRRLVSESSRVAPVDFDDVETGYIARSVTDKFGRAYSDSLSLTCLALRKEWELARARGISTDPYGREYPSTAERYIESCATEVMEAAGREVDSQCLRMNEVLSECASVGNPTLGSDFEALGSHQQRSWSEQQAQAEYERDQRRQQQENEARAQAAAQQNQQLAQEHARRQQERRERARANRKAAAVAVGRGIRAIFRATGRSLSRMSENAERDRYRAEMRRKDRDSRERQELTKLMLKDARRRDRSWW